MAYVITCHIKGIPYGVRANASKKQFELIKITNETILSKILSHPHKTGIIDILDWIRINDKKLAAKGLAITDEQLFYR